MHETDGKRFETRHQMRRYRHLKERQASGEISDLMVNLTIPLRVDGRLITRIKVHFTYLENGRRVTEVETGRQRPELYEIKRELYAAIYKVEIQEFT